MANGIHLAALSPPLLLRESTAALMMMMMEEEVEVWRSPSWLYPAILTSCALLLLLLYRTRKDTGTLSLPISLPASFLSFQRKFLAVFFVASVAESLDAVYGESLLKHKGLKRDDIALLLAAGNIASLFVGTILGFLTDYMGRKKACVMYCLLQMMSSLAKHSNQNAALWIATIAQGLGTSLLLCAFETWMAAEHEKSGFRPEWISETFWLMAFGGSVTAIGSGGLANFLVKWHSLGMVAPSMAAGALAGFSAIVIILWWEENSLSSHSKVWGSTKSTFQALYDKKIVALGWTHACFDFASTVFWFLWIPTLVADGRELHSGIIYPCLMASEMLGSIIAAMLLCGPWNVRPEDFLRWVILCAMLSLMVPAYDYQEIGVLVTAFCIFHICYGIAWPTLARLRSIYIPTEQRASVISLFRVPVNIAVVFILINGSIGRHLENSSIFSFASAGLLSGVYSLYLLNYQRRQSHEKTSTERP